MLKKRTQPHRRAGQAVSPLNGTENQKNERVEKHGRIPRVDFQSFTAQKKPKATVSLSAYFPSSLSDKAREGREPLSSSLPPHACISSSDSEPVR